MDKHSLRKDSPFAKEQATFIILKYGEVRNTTVVRRAFKKHFHPKNPRAVPQNTVFQRLIDRFLNQGSVIQKTPEGLPPHSEDEIHAVKMFFERDPKAHIRKAVVELAMPYGKVWKILRKDLKFKPFRPHLSQILSPANIEVRVAGSIFLLSFTEDQFERILWSDEKWFVLDQAPNRKNGVIWGPQNTRNVVPCKKAHGQKVMAWVGIIDGSVLPVHWFEGNVTSSSYLDMLKTKVWPAIRFRATIRNYWFMQDGASPHCTEEVLDFLSSKFGDRIISRKSTHPWPPYSPDLNPLDFSFWSQAMAHVVRCEPNTLEDLKTVMEDFAENLDPEKARSMARHARYRAELCRGQNGGHFEDLVRAKNRREE